MNTNPESQKTSANVVVVETSDAHADQVCDALRRKNVEAHIADSNTLNQSHDVVVVVTSSSHAIDALATNALGPTVLVLDDAKDPSALESAALASLALGGADAVVALDGDADRFADSLEASISTLSNGGTVLRPDVAREIADHARGRAGTPRTNDVALTRREIEILQCVGRGETVRKTAASLGISAKTVENLQSRLFRKLNVKDRNQAYTRACALGLLREP